VQSAQYSRPQPLISIDRYRGVVFEGTSKRASTERRSARIPGNAVAQHQTRECHSLAEKEFVRRMLACAGLNAYAYRLTPLVRRIPACLRALRVSSVDQAQVLLQESPAHCQTLLDALLIGTTSFFRDNHLFDQLRQVVLRMNHPHLNVWSVGCSDGAELYSVAILLAGLGMLAGSKLRGTDCRPAAIAKAKAGQFLPSTTTFVPAHLVQSYFRPDGRHLTIRECLRTATEWEVADVLCCESQKPWDLILCRNLSIYLSEDAARQLWSKLTAALRPGAILMVGRAERLELPLIRRLAPCIYLKDERR